MIPESLMVGRQYCKKQLNIEVVYQGVSQKLKKMVLEGYWEIHSIYLRYLKNI